MYFENYRITNYEIRKIMEIIDMRNNTVENSYILNLSNNCNYKQLYH